MANATLEPTVAGGFLRDPEMDTTTFQVIELVLKDPGRLDELNRVPERQADLLPRFLLIGLTSYLAFSFMMVLIINLAPAAAYPDSPLLALPAASWSDGTALALPLGYTVSVMLAACVCLPSFYFYSLLAGVRMTWLQIVSVVGKGTAASAIMLLGLLPIYVAVMMGLIVFAAPLPHLQWALAAGLALPFLAGMWGLRAIYQGISDLAAAMPESWRCRRACFLRRLTVSWAAVYTAVLPVMIYRLWEQFAAWIS